MHFVLPPLSCLSNSATEGHIASSNLVCRFLMIINVIVTKLREAHTRGK